MAVYTPLRRRNHYAAIALSNTVGLAVDSALFLWLAHIPFAALPGQVIGKLEMTALAIGLIWIGRMARQEEQAK